MVTASQRALVESGFWTKLRNHALAAGREVVEKALWLYYAARAPQTPAWARSVIYGALAYLVLPSDAIPDALPAIGFTDDLATLSAAVATVALFIDDAVKERAAARLSAWFPPVADRTE
ncbi:YkvA family protein [Pseudohaliea sp.]|uniref:YkvA family protein n=1 Tax=Pseudohaliea sp. TaxID=2740289 RepID=UPI0032EF4A6E